jgi:hypothetical protein
MVPVIVKGSSASKRAPSGEQAHTTKMRACSVAPAVRVRACDRPRALVAGRAP